MWQIKLMNDLLMSSRTVNLSNIIVFKKCLMRKTLLQLNLKLFLMKIFKIYFNQ